MPAPTRYTNFQMETNRHSGQTSQKVLQRTLIFLESAVKWLAYNIGVMFKLFLGK